MFVSKAAVVGGGTMGGEIAQAIAAADIPVVVKDIDQKFVDAAVEKARAVTEGQLARLVKKEKLTQEQADARLAEVMGLITGTTSYDEFGDVDFVIEAVPEKMAIKQAVFREIDAATPGHAILSSNTSSLSITEIGESTLRADKVVGFHFFYPASVMPLVEVIVGEDTSQETATAAYNFAQAIKKQPIVCGEVPGFVVNKILMATIGEIWRAQEEHGLSLAPDRPGDRRGQSGADGAVLPHRPARPRHRPPRRRAPQRVLRRDLLRPPGPASSWSPTASSAPRAAARASSRTASRRSRATPPRTPRSWWRCSPAAP